MNQKLLYSSLTLLAFGMIGRIYANQYTHITPDGVLHDTILLPISTMMFLIGLAALLMLSIFYAINARQTR